MSRIIKLNKNRTIVSASTSTCSADSCWRTHQIFHKMDTSTLIIGVTVALICVMPFVLASTMSKRREKKLMGALNLMADAVPTKYNNFEVFRNGAIAIDENDAYVFFARLANGLDQKCINLNDVKQCNVVENFHNSDTVADTMGLKFILADGKQEEFLEFFNSDIEATSEGVSQLLGKWNLAINAKLASRR